MPPLPQKINPDGTNGFYLRPGSGIGSEAIVYLPAYNDFVRNQLTRRGYKLLSDAIGDFSEKAPEEALRIRPPSDETIREMIADLESRQVATKEKMYEALKTAKEAVEDSEGSERRLYRQRIRQLEAQLKVVEKGIPTFAQAKSLFVRVLRAQIARGINPSVREALGKLSEDQMWAVVEANLNEDIRAGAAERDAAVA